MQTGKQTKKAVQKKNEGVSTIPFNYPLRQYTFQLIDYFIRGSNNTPPVAGTICTPVAVGIQDIQQALGHMHLGTVITEVSDAMIVTPLSPDRANMFSMCFSKEFAEYDLFMDLGDGTDNVNLYDVYDDKMDIVGIGRILDVAPHGPHSAFDLFVVSILETNGVTLYDACTDKMDTMSIGCILDAALREPRSALDLFGVSMLELDDDGFVPDVIALNITSVERAFDYVDPHLSFDSMSRFVTRYDDMPVEYNNDMSFFEYSSMSLHCPMIAPPTATTQIYDIDDVGGPNDSLSGQSRYDYGS